MGSTPAFIASILKCANYGRDRSYGTGHRGPLRDNKDPPGRGEGLVAFFSISAPRFDATIVHRIQAMSSYLDWTSIDGFLVPQWGNSYKAGTGWFRTLVEPRLLFLPT